MKNKNKSAGKVFRAFAMVSQFGINMLVPIGLMLWLGIWLDGKFGTSWIVILCFFAGAAAGFRNVYRMAKGMMNSPDGRDS